MRPALLALALAGCTTPRPPPLVLGTFVDDYGIRYTITPEAWTQHPRARYDVARWHAADGYLIARNAPDHPSDAGKWTRIDWVALPDMAPYTWAFCLGAYDAPTRAAAETTRVAQRATPRTGCNGYPFSRMRPATPADAVAAPNGQDYAP